VLTRESARASIHPLWKTNEARQNNQNFSLISWNVIPPISLAENVLKSTLFLWKDQKQKKEVHRHFPLSYKK
jgi:hypothetical protein